MPERNLQEQAAPRATPPALFEIILCAYMTSVQAGHVGNMELLNAQLLALATHHNGNGAPRRVPLAQIQSNAKTHGNAPGDTSN